MRYRMQKYDRNNRLVSEAKFTDDDLERFSTPSFLDELHKAGLAGIAYQWDDGTRTVWTKEEKGGS